MTERCIIFVIHFADKDTIAQEPEVFRVLLVLCGNNTINKNHFLLRNALEIMVIPHQPVLRVEGHQPVLHVDGFSK